MFLTETASMADFRIIENVFQLKKKIIKRLLQTLHPVLARFPLQNNAFLIVASASNFRV